MSNLIIKYISIIVFLVCLPAFFVQAAIHYNSRLYQQWKAEIDTPDPLYEDYNPEIDEKITIDQGICDNPAGVYCERAVKICGDDQQCKKRIIENNVRMAIFTISFAADTEGAIIEMIKVDDIAGLQGMLENLGSYFAKMENAPGLDYICKAIEGANVDSLKFLLNKAGLNVNYIVYFSSTDERDCYGDYTPLALSQKMLTDAREKNNNRLAAKYKEIIKILTRHGALEVIPEGYYSIDARKNLMGDDIEYMSIYLGK